MKWLAVLMFLSIPVTAYAPLEKKYCPTETHWHYHVPDELQVDIEDFNYRQLEEIQLRGSMCLGDPHCLEVWPISGNLWEAILRAAYIQRIRVWRTPSAGATYDSGAAEKVRVSYWWEDAYEQSLWERFESESL